MSNLVVLYGRVIEKARLFDAGGKSYKFKVNVGNNDYRICYFESTDFSVDDFGVGDMLILSINKNAIDKSVMTVYKFTVVTASDESNFTELMRDSFGSRKGNNDIKI